MTVTDHAIDREALTLTFVAEFAAPVERVWQVWAEPRQLERWWGPPEWPATFTRHELVVGGEPAADMPVTHAEARLDDIGDGSTRMTLISTFPSLEALDELAAMGMVEGMSSALGQIDALLADR